MGCWPGTSQGCAIKRSILYAKYEQVFLESLFIQNENSKNKQLDTPLYLFRYFLGLLRVMLGTVFISPVMFNFLLENSLVKKRTDWRKRHGLHFAAVASISHPPHMSFTFSYSHYKEVCYVQCNQCKTLRPCSRVPLH